MDTAIVGALFELGEMYTVGLGDEDLAGMNEDAVKGFIFVNWLLTMESLRVSSLPPGPSKEKALWTLQGKRDLVTATQKWMQITPEQIETSEQRLFQELTAPPPSSSPGGPSLEDTSSSHFEFYRDLEHRLRDHILAFITCPYDKLSVVTAMPREALRMGWREQDLHFEIGFTSNLKLDTVHWSSSRILRTLMQIRPEWRRVILEKLEGYLAKGGIRWGGRLGMESVFIMDVGEEVNQGEEPFTMKMEVELSRRGFEEQTAKLEELGGKIWDLVVVQVDMRMEAGEVLRQVNQVLRLTPNVRRLEVEYTGGMRHGPINNLGDLIMAMENMHGGEQGEGMPEGFGGVVVIGGQGAIEGVWNQGGGQEADDEMEESLDDDLEGDGGELEVAGGNQQPLDGNGVIEQIRNFEVTPMEHLKTVVFRLMPFSGEESPLWQAVKERLKQAWGEQARIFELHRVGHGGEPEAEGDRARNEPCKCGKHLNHRLDKETMQFKRREGQAPAEGFTNARGLTRDMAI